jgi:hypothetical protein
VEISESLEGVLRQDGLHDVLSVHCSATQEIDAACAQVLLGSGQVRHGCGRRRVPDGPTGAEKHADLAWACMLILEETMQVLAGPDQEIRLARPLRRATLTTRGDLGRLPRVTHSPNSAAPTPARKGCCSCWPATVRSPTSQGRSFPKQRSPLGSPLLCAADRTR